MNTSEKIHNFAAVILAAGKGTRMHCEDTPKVMLEIGGKPMVSYIVDTLHSLGFQKEQICLVVGFHREKVMQCFGDRVTYAVQEEQLGTAHAAYTGMKVFPENVTNILVLGGDDSSFYTTVTIKNLIGHHLQEGSMATLLTTDIEPTSFAYGRIVRKDGLIEIIEKEYLTEANQNLTETSTGTFCFNRQWFTSMFPNMPQLDKLGEYGLPTVFTIAQQEGLSVQVVKLEDSNEWFGINTKEELQEADQRKKLFL